MKIGDVVAFTEFLGKLSAVKRTVKLKATNDFENDAEHSFQVALMSWYVADALKIPVNTERLLTYALAHDVVEVFAGDTDPVQEFTGVYRLKGGARTRGFEDYQDLFPRFSGIASSNRRVRGPRG